MASSLKEYEDYRIAEESKSAWEYRNESQQRQETPQRNSWTDTNPGFTAPTDGEFVPELDDSAFGLTPLQTVCPSCGVNIMTSVQAENGPCAYFLSCLIFLICCPLFWVPLITNFSKDIVHYCPNCGLEVGIKKPFF